MPTKTDEALISAVIKSETNERLETLAKMMQTSKSAIVRWALEEYLNKRFAV